MDAIDYSSAIIKAKQAALAKTKTKTVLKSSTYVAKALPKGPRPDVINSARATYLKSINSSGLKAAAESLGLTIKFGVDAKTWLERNPQIKDRLDELTSLAAEIVKSKALTEQAVSTPADEPSETS